MFKLFRFLKPFALPALVTVILVAAGAVTELYLPTLLADIIDKGVVNGDIPYVLREGGVMLAVTFAGLVCSVIASLLSSRVSMGFGRDLRRKVFTRVEGFSLHE